MKPFLGIDITEDKKNEKANGEGFLIQKPSQAQIDALNNEVDKVVKTVSKTVAKSPFIIGGIILCFLGMVGFDFFSGLSGDKSFKDAYFENPWLIWASGICFIIGIALIIGWKINCKKKFESDEFENNQSNIEIISNNILAELGVPSNSVSVDLISFCYSVKNGELEIKSSLADYDVFSYSVFADEDSLYFANCDGKYAFPISSIKGIKTINEKITVQSWTKDEDPDKGIYKQYKMKYDNEYNVRMKYYHILELQLKGEHWGIYFPCYELPFFESVTGIKV